MYCIRSPLLLATGSRFSVSDDGLLSIDNVQNEDGGEYVCRAFNDVGDPAYEHLTLTIHRESSFNCDSIRRHSMLIFLFNCHQRV